MYNICYIFEKNILKKFINFLKFGNNLYVWFVFCSSKIKRLRKK